MPRSGRSRERAGPARSCRLRQWRCQWLSRGTAFPRWPVRKSKSKCRRCGVTIGSRANACVSREVQGCQRSATGVEGAKCATTAKRRAAPNVQRSYPRHKVGQADQFPLYATAGSHRKIGPVVIKWYLTLPFNRHVLRDCSLPHVHIGQTDRRHPPGRP